MKIVTYAGSVIWNENHPALKKYGDDCLVVRRGMTAELAAKIGDDRDVLVLTDNDPASFELYDTLAAAFHSRRIHLFACLPFTYESSRRKREILARLGKLEMARSLCLVELDAFLAGTDSGETLGSLQLRIRNDMMILLDQAVEAMKDLSEFSQYRYDLENCSYAPADLSLLSGQLTEKLAEKKKSVRAADGEQKPEAAEKSAMEPAMPETKVAPDSLKVPETPEVQAGPETSSARPRRSFFSFLRRKKDGR